jgi:hypothetical protein
MEGRRSKPHERDTHVGRPERAGLPLGDLTGERRVGAVRQRAMRRVCLALALLLPLGAVVAAGGSPDAARHPGAIAADHADARIPSISAARPLRARPLPAPGATRASFSWALVLLAIALASALHFPVGGTRRAAPRRTRAPPDLRFV